MVVYCSSEDLHGRLNDDKLRLLDVREPVEYAGSHIEESVLCPAGNLRSIAATFGKDTHLVVICRTGRRAVKAAEELQGMGYESVSVLRGGIVEWQKQGLPVKTNTTVWPLERQVRLTAGLLVVAGTLFAVTFSPWWLLLPACVGTGLAITAVTDSCIMAAILSYAPWNGAHRINGIAKCS